MGFFTSFIRLHVSYFLTSARFLCQACDILFFIFKVLRLNPGAQIPDVTVGKQFAPGRGNSRLCAPNDIAVTSRHLYVADGWVN